MQDISINENLQDHKKIVLKINNDSDILEFKMIAYQSIINNDYGKAKLAYNEYNKLSENIQDNYIKCDALFSLAMGNYLCGEFNDAYNILKNAYEKVSNLQRINKNKILELKILSNLCLLGLSMSNFKESMEYCNILTEFIRKESDKKFQKEILAEMMQIFFNTDSLNSFFSSNINLHNLNEKILINNDNKNNNESKNKIISKIIFYFHKFLRDDDIDSWIQCLNEESENFKLINESNGFLISIFNMFLSMYIKNPNITEKAKSKILSVCKCIVNTKNENDLKECKEKMKMVALVYKKLQNIETEIETINNSVTLKRKDTVLQNKNSENIMAKIFLTHARNYLNNLKSQDNYSRIPFKYEQILNQIEITLDLIKNNKIDLSDVNVMDFDIDMAMSMKCLFDNLLFIKYKFSVEKYFRKFMKVCLGYDSLQNKLLKKQRRFEAFETKRYLDICDGIFYFLFLRGYFDKD